MITHVSMCGQFYGKCNINFVILLPNRSTNMGEEETNYHEMTLNPRNGHHQCCLGNGTSLSH